MKTGALSASVSTALATPRGVLGTEQFVNEWLLNVGWLLMKSLSFYQIPDYMCVCVYLFK